MMRILFALLLLSLGLPAAFAAENRGETLLVTPVIGLDRLGSDQNRRIVPLTGLRLGYNLTAHWGGEVAFDQVASEGTSAAGLDQADNHFYRADVLYHLTPGEPLVPYLAAGLGLVDRTAPSGAQGRLAPVCGYGVGVKYFLSDEIALRGELRHLVTADGGEGGNFTATIGVTFIIGGARTPVQPQPLVFQRYYADAEPAPVSAQTHIVMPTGDTAVSPPRQLDKGLLDEVVLDQVGAHEPVVARAVEEQRVEKKRIKLEVYFDTAKATIKPIYESELGKVAEYLRENPAASVVIEAHTDNVGSRRYNLKLSQRRGQSVKDFLVKKLGVGRERLTAIGYGYDRPIASNLTVAGRAQNRRVIAVFFE